MPSILLATGDQILCINYIVIYLKIMLKYVVHRKGGSLGLDWLVLAETSRHGRAIPEDSAIPP